MSNINPNELRKMTLEAVRRGEQKRQKEEAARFLAEQRKDAAEKLKAQAVIAEIPIKAEKAANEGRNKVKVYRLEFGEYSYSAKVLTDSIQGVAKLVYDFCDKSDLTPTIEAWDDGVGMNGGYDIVIHW